MDNNLPTNSTNQTGQGQMPQQSAPTQTVPPVAAQPQSPMPQGVVPQKNSHIIKPLLIMIILAIIVLLSILIYVSFVNNQANNTAPIQIQNTTNTQISKPTPATIEEELNSEELNSIDAGNVDEDLKNIDVDLQGL